MADQRCGEAADADTVIPRQLSLLNLLIEDEQPTSELCSTTHTFMYLSSLKNDRYDDNVPLSSQLIP